MPAVGRSDGQGRRDVPIGRCLVRLVIAGGAGRADESACEEFQATQHCHPGARRARARLRARCASLASATQGRRARALYAPWVPALSVANPIAKQSGSAKAGMTNLGGGARKAGQQARQMQDERHGQDRRDRLIGRCLVCLVGAEALALQSLPVARTRADWVAGHDGRREGRP